MTEKAKPREQRRVDPWQVLRYPHLAEKSMKVVDTENKLVFIVNRTADKDDIIDAVEQAFAVRVQSVRTMITPRGEKKAVVTLSPAHSAGEIASRLGVI